ncbi:uncharacterized protein LOC112158151 [Oryzias melastigma]|uniref:uncharacterized protein LOC112158151 n=1 Tax=Oryzias melastigma TaxID=30732 RepID=UPI00168CF0CB|nr:uncharacterized protein LOC112158151 [Oryzias melastigma]
MTLRLEFIIIFMLQSGGISGQIIDLYKRVGEEALLHCNVDASSDQCSDVTWYNSYVNATGLTNEGQSSTKNMSVREIKQSLVGASRLSVNSDCSLFIRNITDEDAGFYTCRVGNSGKVETIVFLHVLSISSSSDIHGGVQLTCSMKTYYEQDLCEKNSIIWLDHKGSELTDKNAEFKVTRQKNCVSVLTVKHPSGNNKRFTCKFVKENKVKIDAVYVLDISESSSSSTVIMVGAVVGVVLVLLVVFTVLLFRSRRAKAAKDRKRGTNFQKPTHQNSDPTYAAVNHSRSKTSSQITMKKEGGEVIYSSIKVK